MHHFTAHQQTFSFNRETCSMSTHLLFNAESRPDSSKREHCKGFFCLFVFFFFQNPVCLKKWKVSTGAGTAVKYTEVSLSPVQFFNLFWQSKSLLSPLWPDDKNVIFMPWCPSSSLFTDADDCWGGLLGMSGGGGDLVAVLALILFKTPSSLTFWLLICSQSPTGT